MMVQLGGSLCEELYGRYRAVFYDYLEGVLPQLRELSVAALLVESHFFRPRQDDPQATLARRRKSSCLTEDIAALPQWGTSQMGARVVALNLGKPAVFQPI